MCISQFGRKAFYGKAHFTVWRGDFPVRHVSRFGRKMFPRKAHFTVGQGKCRKAHFTVWQKMFRRKESKVPSQGWIQKTLVSEYKGCPNEYVFSRDKNIAGVKKRFASGRPGAYSASWEIKLNYGKCFFSRSGPVWLGFAYMAWTGRKKQWRE